MKKTSLSNHIGALRQSMNLFTTKYQRLLLLGDFNAGMEVSSIKRFCNSFNLISMINKPTCYKNPGKSTSVDLILTNSPESFQNSCVIEEGLSDSHKMIVTVMNLYPIRKLHQKLQITGIISVSPIKGLENRYMKIQKENYRKPLIKTVATL